MSDFDDRVRQAALETPATAELVALTPREAAKAEKDAAREAKAAEDARIASLQKVVARFRSELKVAGDPGTGSFTRGQVKGRLRGLAQRSPRGWVIGSLAGEVVVPGQYGGLTRPCELQLILLTNGRVNAAADGAVWERYRFGQQTHPEMAVSFPMQAWRDLEETIPETIGHHIGHLKLDWRLDD